MINIGHLFSPGWPTNFIIMKTICVPSGIVVLGSRLCACLVISLIRSLALSPSSNPKTERNCCISSEFSMIRNASGMSSFCVRIAFGISATACGRIATCSEGEIIFKMDFLSFAIVNPKLTLSNSDLDRILLRLRRSIDLLSRCNKNYPGLIFIRHDCSHTKSAVATRRSCHHPGGATS
jgi:hypothetical protein